MKSDRLLSNLRTLLAAARGASAPIFYLRHSGAGEPAPGSAGWQIHSSIAPRPDEIVIDKHRNDGFLDTSLDQDLRRLEISDVIVGGLQTEFCVDTTCRRAFSLGYRVTLVGDAHGTYDNDVLSAAQIIAHHNHTLGRRMVRVAPTHELQW